MVRELQFFLKRINLLGMAFICGCTTYTPSSNVSTKEKSLNPESVRSQFCVGTKQSKELKFNFTLLDHKTSKGIPLSQSNELMASIEKSKSCLYKSLMFELTFPVNNLVGLIYVEVPDDIFNKVKKEGVGTIDPNSFRSNCRLTTVFVQSPQGKVIGVPTSQCEDGNGHKFFAGSELEFDWSNSYKIKILELSNLMTAFTMIEPKDFQEEAYGCEKNKELCKCIGSKKEYLGLDSDEQFNSKIALEEKDQIWKRYISRFSKFKESILEGQSNVEVTLDLNPFCRYGRSVDDLTSK